MTRTRAADDFETIRARIEELRREREQAEAGQSDTCGQTARAPPAQVSTGQRWSLAAGRTGIADPAQCAARSRRALLISA